MTNKRINSKDWLCNCEQCRNVRKLERKEGKEKW